MYSHYIESRDKLSSSPSSTLNLLFLSELDAIILHMIQCRTGSDGIFYKLGQTHLTRCCRDAYFPEFIVSPHTSLGMRVSPHTHVRLIGSRSLATPSPLELLIDSYWLGIDSYWLGINRPSAVLTILPD